MTVKRRTRSCGRFKHWSAAVIALGLAASGYAMTSARAADELAGEFAWCAGFYTVGGAAAETSGFTGAMEKEQPAIERALELSRRYSDFAHTKARYELALKEQMKVYKAEGISRLILQYGDSCKSAIERPDARLNELRATP